MSDTEVRITIAIIFFFLIIDSSIVWSSNYRKWLSITFKIDNYAISFINVISMDQDKQML